MKYFIILAFISLSFCKWDDADVNNFIDTTVMESGKDVYYVYLKGAVEGSLRVITYDMMDTIVVNSQKSEKKIIKDYKVKKDKKYKVKKK